MKSIIFTFLFFGSLGISNELFSQTYTTESKSCGSCGKAVSNNSKVGMTCPHCSVRWGYENESKSTSYKKTPTYNYKSNNSLGSTTSNANLRSQPSKNSTVLTLIPAYSPVTIIKTVGDWYYVEYSYFDTNTYKTRKLTGYIHKSLIN